MVDHAGFYEVAIGKLAVLVRVHGLASMNNCMCLRDFIDTMLQSDRRVFIIDLSDCRGMDSTFMGVLAGAATFEEKGKPTSILVVNTGENLVRLLRSVGLTELIFVESDPFELPRDVEFVRLEEQATEEQRLLLIRSAHEHLISISDRNEEIFGPFVAALEMEMRQRGIQ